MPRLNERKPASRNPMRAPSHSILAVTNVLKSHCGQSHSLPKSRFLHNPSNPKFIRSLIQQGKLKESIDLLVLLRYRGIFIDADSFALIFRSCASSKSIMEGRRLHAHMEVTGFRHDVFVFNHLINMYGKCGDLEGAHFIFSEMCGKNMHSWNTLLGCYCDAGFISDARRLFDQMPKRDTVSWNTVIAGYDHWGPWEEALKLFTQMRSSDGKVDHFTVSTVISACTNTGFLDIGKELHSSAIRLGTAVNVYVGSALVELYAKCGYVDDARKAFDELPMREAFTWNTMLGGYFYTNKIEQALEFFRKIEDKNVVSWTITIAGCVQHNLVEEAIAFFRQMRFDGSIDPDEILFVAIIHSCACSYNLDEGTKLHALVVKKGFEQNCIIQSALVDMYAKCGNFRDSGRVVEIMPLVDDFTWSVLISEYAKHGNIDKSEDIFRSLKEKSTASWNAMLAGYCELQMHQEALELFKEMQIMGFKGDEFTFGSFLKVLDILDVSYGEQVHVHTIKMGFDSSVFVGSALIEMYTQVFDCESARLAFGGIYEPNLVAWNSLISGYAQNERGEAAIDNFTLMRISGLKPDHVSFSSVLNACSSLFLMIAGMKYHGLAYKSGFWADVVVGSAIVDMYAKCGNMQNAWNAFTGLLCPNVVSWTAIIGGYVQCGILDKAQELFDMMPVCNVVSWNVMISGHAQLGSGQESLRLYMEMKRTAIIPDHITYVNVLTACSSYMMEEQGKQVHAHIVKSDYCTNANVNSTLIIMYQKFDSFAEMNKLTVANYEINATSCNMSN